MGKDPKEYGHWKDTNQPCYCGTEYYFSVLVQWIECDMMSDRGEAWSTAGRAIVGLWTLGVSELAGAALTGGFHDHRTHECIQVTYECSKCNQKAIRTYEIINAEQGKIRNWGHYDARNTKDTRTVRRSYACIERAFDGMWNCYGIIGGDHCKKWSEEFFSAF